MKKILPFLTLLLVGCSSFDEVNVQESPILASATTEEMTTRATLINDTGTLAEVFPTMTIQTGSTKLDVATTELVKGNYNTGWYWGNSAKTFVSYPSGISDIKNLVVSDNEVKFTYAPTSTMDDIVVAVDKKNNAPLQFNYQHIFCTVNVIYKTIQTGHTISSLYVSGNVEGKCTVKPSGVSWEAYSSGSAHNYDYGSCGVFKENQELTKEKFMLVPLSEPYVHVTIDGKYLKHKVTTSSVTAGNIINVYINDDMTFTEEVKAHVDDQKKITKESNGTYTMTLNPYIDGVIVDETITSSAPTDFILVLDYSGSMNDSYSVHSGEASSYQRVSSSGTTTQKVNKRIYALESAVYKFLDEVKKDEANSKVTHRVSMIQFQNPKWPRVNTTLNSERKLYIKEGDSRYLAPYSPGTSSADNANYTTTSVIAQFAEVNDASILTMKKAMSAVTWAGCTAADYGMHLASLQMGKCRKDVGKCIIVFSDGKPTHAYGAILSDCVIPGYYSSGTYLSDDQVIAGAIKYAKVCKDKGAEIFTIFTGDSKQKNNTFLEGVATDKSHFQDASSSSLSDAFMKITQNIQTAHPSMNLGSGTYLLLKFSELFDASKAQVSGASNVVWSDNHQTVKISGFDYSANFGESKKPTFKITGLTTNCTSNACSLLSGSGLYTVDGKLIEDYHDIDFTL